MTTDDDTLHASCVKASFMAGFGIAALSAAAILTTLGDTNGGGATTSVLLAILGVAALGNSVASALRARVAHARGGRLPTTLVAQCVAAPAMLAAIGPMLAFIAVPVSRITPTVSAWFQADRIAMIVASLSFMAALHARNRQLRATGRD